MRMVNPFCIARHAALILPVVLVPAFANAQSSSDSFAGSPTSSSTPSSGFVGINVGTPHFKDKRCSSFFKCDDPDIGGEAYIGTMFNKNFGIQAGYVDFDSQGRNGGDSRAYGANISLLGNIPIDRFSVFGKVGSTYGWTRTSAKIGPTRDKNSWGLSYGAGVGYDVTPRTQVLIEWDRHRVDFVNADNNDIDLYTVGVKYRF